MQPNSPYQQPQVPSDYLDQIAAPQQVKTLNPVLLWGLIGGVLLLAIVVIMGVMSGSKGDTSSSLAGVAARFNNLQSVAVGAQENLQSSELRTLNSSLALSLTNSNRDLAAPLKSQDINLKDKKDRTVIASAAEFAKLDTRLEDARLNAVFDRTYAREVTYQLKTLRSDMAVLYKKSKSKSLKTALATADTNLKPLVEGFAASNAQ
jgi:hypothetical protein